MPPLKVPERYRSGILRTAALEQDQFDQFLSALKSAPTCETVRELQTWISTETPTLTDAERRDMVLALASMLRVQRSAEVSPRMFGGDVWASLQAEVPQSITSFDQEEFVSRIASLMELSSLDITSLRVFDVKQEVERNFCKVKILTDIRPVFKKDPQETPVDMAIIHHFQIGYHDGMGQHKEFYVSLDGRDLEMLKKAVADAESRSETLERTLKDGGVKLHR